MNAARYWIEVRRIEAGLPEKVWVTTVENPAFNTRPGAPSEVPRRIAAELLARQTHRLATEEEVSVFLAGAAKRSEEIAREEAERQTKVVLQLPPELIRAAQSQPQPKAAKQ